MQKSTALARATNNFQKLQKTLLSWQFLSSPLENFDCQSMRSNRQAIAIATNNSQNISKLMFQYSLLVLIVDKLLFLINESL